MASLPEQFLRRSFRLNRYEYSSLANPEEGGLIRRRNQKEFCFSKLEALTAHRKAVCFLYW